METSVEVIEKRVQQGIALLDEKNPGWESKIDLKILSMADCRVCILGQLYTEYSLGLKAIDICSRQEHSYGFDWDFSNNSSLYYSQLTSAWKEAIRQRLDPGPAEIVQSGPIIVIVGE